MGRVKLWLVVGIVVSALGLAACGDDDEDEGGSTTPTEESARTAAEDEPILIKTHVFFPGPNVAPRGQILASSIFGDSPFCPGGTFRDGPGRAPLWAVVKVIRCPGGRLTITFDPRQGTDQAQSGPWRVVSGTGIFEGLSGGGRGRAVFQRNGPNGRETFRGAVSG